MSLQIKMAYAHPEPKFVREPGAPTRPAKSYEVNAWWEDVQEFDGPRLASNGALLRVWHKPSCAFAG